MQIKRVHVGKSLWTYHVGRSYVRITSPQGKSWAVLKSDVLKEINCLYSDQQYVQPRWVLYYIRKHLLYYQQRIIPERGASVLLKRALLKL